jgi:hypothetical protein
MAATGADHASREAAIRFHRPTAAAWTGHGVATPAGNPIHGGISARPDSNLQYTRIILMALADGDWWNREMG